jgi:hypothetical protein
LGDVINELARESKVQPKNPPKWRLTLDDADGDPATASTVLALATLLREGHRDRHAGDAMSKPVTAEGARVAVQVAVTVVQWFSMGAVYEI